MLHRQVVSRPAGLGDASTRALRPFQAAPSLLRFRNSVPTPDVRARSYDDDFEDYGRSGRSGRGGKGDSRRQRGGGKSRKSDDEFPEWDDAAADADTDVVSYSEEIDIPGMTVPSTSSSSRGGGGGAYGFQRGERQQEGGYGRGYGRGGNGGGYGRRGGGGGRGYGRGYERQSGGSQGDWLDEQGGGSGGGGAEGGWQGRREGGRGQFQRQDQGRRFGGGRGGGAAGGEGEGGRRVSRGPREALSAEELAARAANNEAVREARDWRAVAAVLAERGPSLDAENIAAMLFKLARNGRPPGPGDAPEFEALVSSLYGWVSSLAPSLRPKQLATCLYAIAKLELFNAELVGALAAQAGGLMGNFSGYEYSNMVWAFARMNYSPGEEWLNTFVYWTERRLDGFKPVELSNTVASLARLGHVPGAAWLDTFTGAVAKQAGEFNTLEAVNTLFGLASLGYSGGPNPGAWLGPLLAGGTGAAAAGASAGGAAAGGAAGVALAESLRVADLTRTTWALTQFEWEPPAAWLAAATRGFIRNLRVCLPSDLATLSYSLAYLKAAPSPDELKQLAGVLPRAWHKLSGDELANVAMSLALWQYQPPSERWLDELVITARDKLPVCSPDALSKLVSALPLLGRGYRLDQVVAQAQAMLDAGAQQAEGAAEQQVAAPV